MAGTGLRFKLTKSKKHKTYLGSLLMYKLEKSTVDDATTIGLLSNSSYLSFSLFFSKNLSIISTTYYQPSLQKISDFQIAHQSIFQANISKHLSFKTGFTFSFDSYPEIGIPKNQYAISNGIVWKFR